jgi:hypothetical protein
MIAGRLLQLAKPAWGIRVLTWTASLLLVALGILPALLREARPDESWPLYLAERLLEGQRHGVDFYEMNPPLYIWLCLPAVWLHQILGLHHWHAWIITNSLLALASLALAARLDTREPPVASRHGFLLAAGFALLVLPRLQFSEREHVSLLLVLPYVLITARRAGGNVVASGWAAGAGLMGGMGFSLKPHFLVAWVLLELWLATRLGRRSLGRPELWALVGFGALYLGLVMLLVPDYFPMALRLAPIYHTYLNNGIAGAIVMAGPVLLGIAVLALAARRAIPDLDPLRDALTIAFVGYFLAAILQQKGFNYHYLGAWGFGLLLLAHSWLTRPDRISWYPSGILLRAGFVVLAALVVIRTLSAGRELAQPGHPRYQPSPEYAELIRQTRELAVGERIIALSTNPVSGWPLTLSAGARWSSRYMHFWPLVAFYDDQLWSSPMRMVQPRPLNQRTGEERRFHEEVIEDLHRHHPRLVIVLLPDSTLWGMGGARRFDYLEYFGADPRFRDFMSAYQPVRRIGAYEIWSRTPE